MVWGIYSKNHNLATLKIGDLTCKINLVPFILANLNHIISTQCYISISLCVMIFIPFNFAVLFSSQNKGHPNIKGGV